MTALVCAALAGVLGWFVPVLVRSLPEPVGDERPEEDGEKEPYAVLAVRTWVRPVALVVSLVLGGLLGLLVEPVRLAVALAVLVPVGVALGIVDARTRLLPRRIVLPATGVALALLGVEWLVHRDTDVLVTALLGLLAARTLFWVLWFIRRAGMGFGDVRVAALVGLVLGRFGWTTWFVGIYAGLLAFGLFAIGLAIWRRDRSVLRGSLPYGPFMLAGAYAALISPLGG